MRKPFHLWLWLVAYACSLALAEGAAYYVSAGSGNDANSGTSWAQAKRTIQAAVDAASSNDTIWVTNGTYATGSRVAPGQTL